MPSLDKFLDAIRLGDKGKCIKLRKAAAAAAPQPSNNSDSSSKGHHPHHRDLVHDKDSEGNTSLIIASRYGHADIVDWLLSDECCANVLEKDNDGWSPIMWASR